MGSRIVKQSSDQWIFNPGHDHRILGITYCIISFAVGFAILEVTRSFVFSAPMFFLAFCCFLVANSCRSIAIHRGQKAVSRLFNIFSFCSQKPIQFDEFSKIQIQPVLKKERVVEYKLVLQGVSSALVLMSLGNFYSEDEVINYATDVANFLNVDLDLTSHLTDKFTN